MKNRILTFCFFLSVSCAYSQLKVDSQGEVGIGGITNPQEALDVNGDVQVRGKTLKIGEGMGSGIAAVRMGFGRTVNGSTTFDLISDKSNYSIYGFRFTRNSIGSTQMIHRGTKALNMMTQDGARIRFEIGGTEAMRIEDDLNIGIGTNNPQALLHVNGDLQYAGSLISSDKRLKTNESLFTKGLAEVLKIQPYTYFYNGKAGIKSDKLQFGVMAQDMEKILPEMVGTYNYQVDDKNDPNEKALLVDEEYLYVNSSAIQYMLVNAIKEQQDLIKDQQNELALNKEAYEELANVVIQMREELDDLKSGEYLSNHNINVELYNYDFASIEQNNPNPFTGQTKIDYIIPTDSKNAVVNIYSTTGTLIKSINIDHIGEGTITLNTFNVPSGTYTYHLIVDDKMIGSQKMIIMN